MGGKSQTSLNQITDREHPTGKDTALPPSGEKVI